MFFQSPAAPGAVNNRCNLRLLSIFQITDKRILDDCSQMGGGGGEGGLSEEKLLKQLVLERERERELPS